jgi:hypothetical protein
VATAGTAHANITGLYRGQLPPRARPPALGLDGLITLTRPRFPHPWGTPKSRLLSPTTPASSSTQVTQGAPSPPSTGPYRVCAGPRVGQGPTSSLRCGRSTLTNACGPAPHAMRALTDNPTQVTRLLYLAQGVADVPFGEADTSGQSYKDTTALDARATVGHSVWRWLSPRCLLRRPRRCRAGRVGCSRTAFAR